RFIQEITQKSPNNVGVSFINKETRHKGGFLLVAGDGLPHRLKPCISSNVWGFFAFQFRQ
ncbi:MAG: hypothetical protein QF616_05410, partial [Candidatus Marinimicrobia bacterium]|nr:hypothetical protein [Candidatus Neomarinimicrobiota bacterium]